MRKRQTASILTAAALSAVLLTGCGEQQSDECEDTIESSAAVATGGKVRFDGEDCD
jgi:hypothetical protein